MLWMRPCGLAMRRPWVWLDDLDQQLVGALVDGARLQGPQLTGEAGLLAK